MEKNVSKSRYRYTVTYATGSDTPPCTPDPALNNPAHMPISPVCSAVPSRQETAQKRRVNSHSSKCFMMARHSAASNGRLAIGKRHSGSRVAS